jgi:uncharacterized membrane protein (UPF0136 family)
MNHKRLPLLFSLFALTLFFGGAMGYFKAHSIISLVMSSFFGSLILAGAALLLKKNPLGYYITFGSTLLLGVVFIIRYLKTSSTFPGIMAVFCFLTLFFAYYLLKKQAVYIK